MLVALVSVAHQPRDGQRPHFRQPVGQRLLQRLGHFHEGHEHIGIVAGAFEELAEIAEPLDPRRQRRLDVGRQFIHFKPRYALAHPHRR